MLALSVWAGAMVLAFTAFKSQAQWSAPGSTTVELPVGRWTIFEKMPTTGDPPVTMGDIAKRRTVPIEDLRVNGPNGSVSMTCAYCGGASTAMPLDFALANALGSFDVAVPGRYELSAEGQSATLAVADPNGRLLDLLPWLVVLGGVGVAFLASGIWIIARSSNGSSRLRQSGAPPPGWYPNPYIPEGSQMWWDGSKWTSNWR